MELNVFPGRVRQEECRVDEDDIAQDADPLFVTLLPEERNDFLEQEPVNKNALPGVGGKLSPVIPQAGQYIFGKGSQCLFIGQAGQLCRGHKDRGIPAINKFFQLIHTYILYARLPLSYPYCVKRTKSTGFVLFPG